ncbi:MAG: HAMP domain-containing sensor histidine kinase [Acidimicrobiales bacterium]
MSIFRTMNLRRRIAVSVGLFTAVMVMLSVIAAWLLVGRSLVDAVDADLRSISDAIATVGLDRVPDGDRFIPPEIADGDRATLPFVQVLGPDGQPRRTGSLPVTDIARQIAQGGEGEDFESLEVNDRFIRVLTVPLDIEDGGGALQVGTDFTNTVEGLRQARAAGTVAGLLAGLGTAALAWMLSRHLVAPLTAVADAADLMRRSQQIPEPLDGEGPDELGRLVTSFNAMVDDVRHSRDQQRRMVADASHELRTPLTSLRVKIEFIQSQPDLPVDQRQPLLDGAVSELGSLSDLVTELVELAAEGSSEEQPRLVDLADVVATEVDRFRAVSGRQIDLKTSSGLIETRPKQATRALTNLLVNADKYSPKDQPITVRQDGPAIEVRDRGPGIAEVDRERVFDRFYRGPTHQSIEGSGLGLAIVESVAVANGGRAWVSDPPAGEAGIIVGFSVGPTVID